MNKTINPHYLMARRRAERYERLDLTSPAYTRKSVAQSGQSPRPKRGTVVRIGSGRYPGQPIELMPAIHMPPPVRAPWLSGSIAITCAVGVALSFVFVGW